MTRPARLVVVTGTATEVGKTWFAAATLTELRALGVAVAARKPVQSFEPGTGATDAAVLAAATGEDPEEVCPPNRSLAVPMAPPMAADALGAPRFTIANLADELRWPPATDVGVVEGVGGPRSPLAADGDTVDLVTALAPELVVLVADAGLGAINAVLLAAAPFAGHDLLVALNRFDSDDDLHHRNRSWLVERCRADIVTDPRALAERVRPRRSVEA
ncbi:MAG: ATP-dependent dethiobiotin synthetase BioD [Acidimicrobiia bacterium]